MRKIRPADNRILVKKEAPKEKKTEAGIYLAPKTQEQGASSIGDVIDVGRGLYDEKGAFIRSLNVKKGDKVMFGKYAGIEAVINDEAFLLMEEVDIIGIIEEEV